MKSKFKKVIILVEVIMGLSVYINAKSQITLHTIDVKNTSELIDFFKFTLTRSPLVSAHRGGSRAGFPENCLATFENTLQYTPAIFEIDPRLTKDSVAVLMHDATLDRTTTGKGKLCDYTWNELKDLKLKDKFGNITPYGIPLLEEVIEWAKGKTILVLDDKDLPYKMVTAIVRKHDAFSNILMTVRDANIARQFNKLDERFMFEAYVFDMQDVAEYEAAKIPWSHVMAYIGPLDDPANVILYEEMNERGVKCMVSGARYLDKEFLAGKQDLYANVFSHGSDIIESDIPIRTATALNGLVNKGAGLCNYFGRLEIPLAQMYYKSCVKESK